MLKNNEKSFKQIEKRWQHITPIKCLKGFKKANWKESDGKVVFYIIKSQGANKCLKVSTVALLPSYIFSIIDFHWKLLVFGINFQYECI